MFEWFWVNEWYIETVVYYVFRITMILACTVYMADTVRKWVRRRKRR